MAGDKDQGVQQRKQKTKLIAGVEPQCLYRGLDCLKNLKRETRVLPIPCSSLRSLGHGEKMAESQG